MSGRPCVTLWQSLNEIFSVYVYCLPCAALSELNLFLHNDICFLISVVLLGVVSLGLRTTRLVIALTFETFPVVHCWKFASASHDIA